MTIFLACPRAMALDVSGQTFHRFFSETVSERINRGFLYPTAYQANFRGRLRLRPTDVLTLQLGLDSGLLEIAEQGLRVDGLDFGERARETLFLGRTYSELQLGKNGFLQLRAGKLRPRIAGGALYDAYAFGGFLDLDFSLLSARLPLSLRVSAYLPSGDFTSVNKTSPLLSARAAYRVSEHTTVTGLASFLLSREDGAAVIVEDALVRGQVEQMRTNVSTFIRDSVRPVNQSAAEEGFARLFESLDQARDEDGLGYDVTSEGTLGWVGGSVSLDLSPVSLSVTALHGFGSLDVTSSPNDVFVAFVRESILTRAPELQEQFLADQRGDKQLRLSSWFLNAEVAWEVSSIVQLKTFSLFQTGDDGLLPSQNQETYRGFVSVAPLVTYTSIFLAGGVGANLATPSVSTLAPNGAGLLMFGGGVDVQPDPLVSVHLVGAGFWAGETTGEGPGTKYGDEVNLSAEYQLLDYFAVLGDFGVFVPGDYFGDTSAGYQLILGVYGFFP